MKKMLQTPELIQREGFKVAPVDFGAPNKKDIEKLIGDVKKKHDVYQLNVPIKNIEPAIDFSGGMHDISAKLGDTFPPPILKYQPETNTFYAEDGNHRIAYFKDQGYDLVPSVVMDPESALRNKDVLQKALSVNKVVGGVVSKVQIRKMVGTVVNVQQEIKDFERLTSNVFADGLTVGFNLGREQNLAAALNVSQILDIPAARRALKKMTLKAATKALNTTQKDLAKLIAKSIRAGDGAKDLAAKISDKFELQYLGKRSLLVARTEGTGVLNSGTILQMQEDGTGKKKWRATLDDRVRETHAAVMAETMNDPIPVDEPFRVGDSEGMYPGDQSLSIEERANCRCALVNADFDAIRCRYYDRFFLREHGSYERKLQQAVMIYFRRMKERILSRIEDISLPTL